jgi:hypothetical protein
MCVALRRGLPGEQVNYNLLTVNVFMAATGMYQLSRKAQHEMNKGK